MARPPLSLGGASFSSWCIPAVVAGNIGRPLTEAVSHLTAGTWVVAEVSSFQLEYTTNFVLGMYYFEFK